MSRILKTLDHKVNTRGFVKPLRHNGVAYSGINVLVLWVAAMRAGFVSPIWMVFKHAKELGAHVCKGERCKGRGFNRHADHDDEHDRQNDDRHDHGHGDDNPGGVVVMIIIGMVTVTMTVIRALSPVPSRVVCS